MGTLKLYIMEHIVKQVKSTVDFLLHPLGLALVTGIILSSIVGVGVFFYVINTFN